MESDLPIGYWWRAEEYVLQDGYIRPAPGAAFVRYNPWDYYRLARQHGKQEDLTPYQELLKLADIRFVFTDNNRLAAEPDDARRILDWCNRYGLLGVLLQRVREARFAPRWQRIRFPGAETDLLYPTQSRVVRTATGWREQVTHKLMGTVLEGEPDREGTLVEEDERPADMPVGALIRRLDTFDWQWEPLSNTWARFFPDTPREERETREYPLPLSTDFWREYAEPLDHFVTAVRALVRALHYLEQPSEVRRGRELINVLAEDVSLVLAVDVDEFRQAWVATSLLGTLAAMAIFDLTGGKRVRRCETCGRPFVSGAPAARYCSPTCRQTAQKRAYRQRIREAKALWTQGLSVEQIAAQLGSDIETVRGWLSGKEAK